MSSIGDYLFRLKNQLNPLDHGKTAANPTGLPMSVPIQTPGLDTTGPTVHWRNKPVPVPTMPDRTPSIREQLPLYGTDNLLKGFYQRPQSPLQPGTAQAIQVSPLQYPAGDYQIPTRQSYENIHRLTLPVQRKGINKPIRTLI